MSASRAEQVRAALQALYDETADYIRINHLGDVHHNRSMQLARDALSLKVEPLEWEQRVVEQAGVVVDMWEDGDLPPEHRCYVPGAFRESMNELAALLQEPGTAARSNGGPSGR